uniref:DM13 domain-containing protein n=1 Tax=Ascaris lumbricoides TaxID=6252 RepID=A0A9J2P368_ASCLU
MPWSKYRQLHASSQGSGFATDGSQRHTSAFRNYLQRPSIQSKDVTTLDSSIPVIISLPPYKVAPGNHTKSLPPPYSGSPYRNGVLQNSDQSGPRNSQVSHRSAIYSTASSFQPVSQVDRLKIFRGKGGKGFTDNSEDSLERLSEKIVTGEIASQPMNPHVNVRSYATVQTTGSALSSESRSLPEVQYSRLAPAPLLPVSPMSTNIAESIFAQSQIRHAPRGIIGNSIGNAIDGGTSLFSSENAVENISKFARNLLILPASNQELFSALASLLTGPKLPAPTNNALVDTQSASTASNIINAQEVFPSLAKKNLEKEGSNLSSAGNITESLLKQLPEEQRSLLQAAIQSGELEAHALASAMRSASNDSKIISDNRLLEWIQQNRPQASNRRNNLASISEKLPYYGRYCGSFSEQADLKKQFAVTGAVWAVDDRRFVVSKFQFIPGSLDAENVTFWAGPEVITGNMVDDIFPSVNGFYLRPEPIDLTEFLSREIKIVEAKIRTGQTLANNSKSPLPLLEVSDTNHSVEAISADIFNETTAAVLRRRSISEEENTKKTFELLLKGVILKAFEDDTQNASQFITYDDMRVQLNETVYDGEVTATLGSLKTTSPEKISTRSAGLNLKTAHLDDSKYYPQPLGWHAGFQPILLTLPDDKWLKTVYWLSLRDHKRNRTVSSVLIPNGPAFKIPAIVQLRPLVSNGVYSVSSGPIKVLDTKTIEISNFTLGANGIAAWFIVGKDILPNGSGHIVPIYDRSHSTFDCDSLRDYSNETVTLRLPGSLDVKDVFWFSVFSITEGISLSHIYLPYNDMHLPPDLNAVAKYAPMQFYVCYLSVPGSCHIILANIKITSAPINAKFFVYSSHAEFIINGSISLNKADFRSHALFKAENFSNEMHITRYR